MTDSSLERQPEPQLLRPEMPELDTVRGAAVLGVFLYHALYTFPGFSQWSRNWRLVLTAAWAGHLGVHLFFVLSGFLITRILLKSRQTSTYYRTFYVRRGLRILPAYLLLLLVLLVTRTVSLPFILISLVYLANFARLFGIGRVYRVLWSLAVEEQFYLIWPLFVRRLSLQALRFCCFGIIVLSPLARYATWRFAAKDGLHDFLLNYFTWNVLDGLACGALLLMYLYESRIPRAGLKRGCLALLGASAVMWFSGIPFGILSSTSPFAAAFQIVPWNFAFTAVLGLALVSGTGPSKRLVNIKWLQFLGYISYGLYLCHPMFLSLYDRIAVGHPAFQLDANHPATLFLRAICAGGGAILAAYLSRRYFEEWFLQFKNRWT